MAARGAYTDTTGSEPTPSSSGEEIWQGRGEGGRGRTEWCLRTQGGPRPRPAPHLHVSPRRGFDALQRRPAGPDELAQ